jgi:hypothetical protein
MEWPPPTREDERMNQNELYAAITVSSVTLLIAVAALVCAIIASRPRRHLVIIASAVLVVIEIILLLMPLPPMLDGVGFVLALLGVAIAVVGGGPAVVAVLDLATRGSVADGTHGGIMVAAPFASRGARDGADDGAIPRGHDDPTSAPASAAPANGAMTGGASGPLAGDLMAGNVMAGAAMTGEQAAGHGAEAPADVSAGGADRAGERTGQPVEVLRGGATIGYLERVAVAASLLAGYPEGLAVVVAIKGVGRFSELSEPETRERFIIGTFASLVWASAGAAIALLAR